MDSDERKAQAREIYSALRHFTAQDRVDVAGLGSFEIESDDCDCAMECPSCDEWVTTTYWKIRRDNETVQVDALAMHMLDKHGVFAHDHKHHDELGAPGMVRDKLVDFLGLDRLPKPVASAEWTPFEYATWHRHPEVRPGRKVPVLSQAERDQAIGTWAAPTGSANLYLGACPFPCFLDKKQQEGTVPDDQTRAAFAEKFHQAVARACDGQRLAREFGCGNDTKTGCQVCVAVEPVGKPGTATTFSTLVCGIPLHHSGPAAHYVLVARKGIRWSA